MKKYMKKEDSTTSKIGIKQDILYANPAKPLDFSAREVRVLEDLRKMEARSGNRRPISEIEKEEAEKIENMQRNEKFNNNSYDDETSEKYEKKTKNETSDIVTIERNKEYKTKLDGDETATAHKLKVKYKTYNNSVILHSNKIKSLANVDKVFEQILPDVDFLVNKNHTKIDLIQWIDISHNLLVDIHPDILKLPFLKILYCHANCIEEIASVAALSHCKSLINLTLHGNPIEHIKGYRSFIIEMVPFLEKLDYSLVSDKELDIILHKGSRYGEKRKKGVVVSYPKIDSEVLKRMKKPREEDQEKKDDN
jgi:hypothetical protein